MEIKVQDFENMSKEELVYILKNIKYGLTWSANENTKEHFEKKSENAYPVLKGVPEKDILTDKEKPTNLLIEGDNYHVLSVMQYTHKNSIDVIYIDPPYNTGNKDFVYNDKFIDKDDTWRHSKWLSFMNKRLRLARELLKDDGVIFISIDDNEQAQLKLLCDEIFGEDNFIGNIIQNKGNSQNDAISIQKNHEYILTYKKKNIRLYQTVVDKRKVYRDKYGYFYKGAGLVMGGGTGGTLNGRPNLGYSIYYNPKTKDIIGIQDQNLELARTSNLESEIYNNKKELIEQGYVIIRPTKNGTKLGCWKWGLEKFNNNRHLININKIKDKYSITQKKYVNENDVIDEKYVVLKKKQPSRSIIDYSTSKGTTELKEIFGSKLFDNPKNKEMIKYLINLHTNSNAIVLDFFAGSGTTGHAVLELNKEDGGNRQFILVTNNENNICTDVTHPRIQKVIEGYTTPKGKEVEGLGGNLKYYKTDFVEKSTNSDQMLNNLVRKCTDILCIKENVFELVSDKRFYQIYQSNEKTMAVFAGTRTTKRLQKLQEELSQFDGEKVLYCFTLNPTGMEVEPEIYELFKGIRIEPIPHEMKHMLEEAMSICK